MMVSFMDFRKIPIASLWEETNFGIYGDNLSHGGINMWVNRHACAPLSPSPSPTTPSQGIRFTATSRR